MPGCCEPVRSSPSVIQHDPNKHPGIRTACKFTIFCHVLYYRPKAFVTGAGIGFVAHLFNKNLSEDISKSPEFISSACTRVMERVFDMRVDERIAHIFATLFFCSHIPHGGWYVSFPVGVYFGFYMHHLVGPPLRS